MTSVTARAALIRFCRNRLLLAPFLAISLFYLLSTVLAAQEPVPGGEFHVDSDHDGMSDTLEQALLVQFVPKFMIDQHDCSNVPAEFQADKKTPELKAENGTIYGQVFPAKTLRDKAPAAEVHYYHLWRRDCGGHGHPLDTEHVQFSFMHQTLISHRPLGRQTIGMPPPMRTRCAM